MDRWELEKKIVMKALKDPSFKKQLLEKPKEALKNLLQGEENVNPEFLEKIRMHIVEEQQGEWILSLPHLPYEKVQRMSAKELENLFAAYYSPTGGFTICC